MVHFTSLVLFDAQRRKKMDQWLLEQIKKVKTCNSGGKNEKNKLMAPKFEPGTFRLETQTTKRYSG